ncbi:transposase [Microvirga sp. TS319]|uniref:transposase n=1 Tax=Microvirga sp. TS319 TaxID=3241165 RepID=UPI003519F245
MSIETSTATQMLVPKVRQMKPEAVLVMNNLLLNRVMEVGELLAQAWIGLLYLPRYSPEFNPTEHARATTKERLKAKAARSRPCRRNSNQPSHHHRKYDNGWFRDAGYALL